MGSHIGAYIGPVVKLNGKHIDLVKSRRCDNFSCKEHRNMVTTPFCPFCGTEPKEVECGTAVDITGHDVVRMIMEHDGITEPEALIGMDSYPKIMIPNNNLDGVWNVNDCYVNDEQYHTIPAGMSLSGNNDRFRNDPIIGEILAFMTDQNISWTIEHAVVFYWG